MGWTTKTAGIALLLLVGAAGAPAAVGRSAQPDFGKFERRAKAGERLSVVFFGASLTWGANATDPNLTSYRGLIARKLESTYPSAHFQFRDSAIGGTGSQLGAFRFDRDVLRHAPDLVFLEFSANDNINTDDPESQASYEALIRRTILEAKAPVVQVILPFRQDIAVGRTDGMKRRTAHLRLSEAYRTAVADVIDWTMRRVSAGDVTLDVLWPVEGAHPCDLGYSIFTDAVWSAVLGAVHEGRVCRAPDRMLNAPTYMTIVRAPLCSLGPLPAGWRSCTPNVVAAYFDHLMSRWLDNEVVASHVRGAADIPSPWRLRFRGETLMLLGESTPASARYRVAIDGRHVAPRAGANTAHPGEFEAGALATMIHGNTHHAQVIAVGLDPDVEHVLKIEPVFPSDADGELRLESVCVAGKSAMVRRME